VGVTSFIGASPSRTDPNAAEQLEAFATWTQDFANNGSESLGIFADLEIPALELGLFNVVPEATTFRGITETAEAEATMAFIVTHADGSTTKFTPFEFGMRVFEQQVLSGAQVFNVVDHEFIGANAATLPLFNSFHDNGDGSNPRLFIDAVSIDIALPDLLPGDTLDTIYQLAAKGTTNGGEQGFIAFLGDPFEVDGSSGGFTFETTTPTASVPEPATWVLMIVGFGVVAGLAGRRRALAAP
jgi:PEP-CTERM motif